jgi:hypothetical protein
MADIQDQKLKLLVNLAIFGEDKSEKKPTGTAWKCRRRGKKSEYATQLWKQKQNILVF